MAMKNYKNNKQLLAKIVTDTTGSPCSFCGRDIDEELAYGKLYSIGNINCHYFCALLSCCLIQKGHDHEGLFGFLYPDILAEIERSKKHKCSYCGAGGASIGCSVSQCKKQFHLPCGRERNSVSLFYGNYKSFCVKHAPKQKIPNNIMAMAKNRLSKLKACSKQSATKKYNTHETSADDDDEKICVICYEVVEGYPTPNTFWPPCCGRDAWFHRSCLVRMALNAGVHHLKCPLCNEKENFREEVLRQGYYVPDRDAAWELEQNAYSDMYWRAVHCGAGECACPEGRAYDADGGPWDINMCILCGGSGMHAACRGGIGDAEAGPYVCPPCAPAATDAPQLVQTLHELAIQEQNQNGAERERVARPVMPSRMSLRRTKGRCKMASSSKESNNKKEIKEEVTDISASRLELNLKTPKRNILEPAIYRNVENMLLSPMKLLEEGLKQRVADAELVLDGRELVDKMREMFKKPKPLVIKKKIVNTLLEELLNMHSENFKRKESPRVWISPKKFMDIKQEDIKLQIEDFKTDNIKQKQVNNYKTSIKTEIGDTNINVSDESIQKCDEEEKTLETLAHDENNDLDTTVQGLACSPVQSKCILKFTSINNKKLEERKTSIDVESFKIKYLNEVRVDTNIKTPECNVAETRKRKLDVTNDSGKRIKINYIDASEREKRKKKKRKARKMMIKVENKKDNDTNVSTKLTQYVLNCDSKQMNISPPQATPVRTKRMRTKKKMEKLKQTSLVNFFGLKCK